MDAEHHDEIDLYVEMWLYKMVAGLVDKTDELTVTREGSVLRLGVARSDMGKVLGVEGRHARAIRQMLHAVGRKYRRMYELDIVRDAPAQGGA